MVVRLSPVQLYFSKKKGNRYQLWKDLEQAAMGLPNVNLALLFWGPPNAQMMGHSEPASTIAP